MRDRVAISRDTTDLVERCLRIRLAVHFPFGVALRKLLEAKIAVEGTRQSY